MTSDVCEKRISISGHLGAKKTEIRIIPTSYGFAVPVMCAREQSKRGSVKKVILGSIRLLDMPFKRVAVDIVGTS